jgi:predicted enzyme related to lactoylglutathione lyase
MPDRNGFPPGVPAWIDTAQPDVDGALAFYGGLFGWTFDERGASDPDGRYVVASLDGKTVAAIAAVGAGHPPTPGWSTYVTVDDADETADRVRAGGGTVLVEPGDRFDVARVALCADPEGATFGLWQPRTIRGAESVNAPGTWNFSELNTADSTAAARFYGSVFDWETSEVDMGAMSGTMVRMPGYADFLEAINPGTKQRHVDFGAPPGFTECVAWFLPLSEGASPHWSLTFSVADADSVAARAAELGGSVLVEPFDLPMVRSTVIRDPAGAVFTANAFNPGG